MLCIGMLRYAAGQHRDGMGMGFLDDLKRQAAALKAERELQSGHSERHAMLADAACKTIFQYWLQLAEQLNTLQPSSPARYALDTRLVLRDLKARDFRVDSRRRGSVREQDHYDHVVMHWTLKGPRGLVAKKDFLNDIQRLESRLRQAGITPLTEAVRDEHNGKLQSMEYAYDADIASSLRAEPDHANGCVRFQCVNVDGLETLTATLPAFEVGSARLDELAKWLLGEPHRFLQGTKNLRRSVPD